MGVPTEFDPKGQLLWKGTFGCLCIGLDGKVPKGNAEEAEEQCFSLLKAKKALSEGNIPSDKMLSEEAFYAGLKVTAEHIEECVADRISKMQEALLRQLTKELEEYALRTVWGEDTPHREQYEEERSKCRRRICRMP